MQLEAAIFGLVSSAIDLLLPKIGSGLASRVAGLVPERLTNRPARFRLLKRKETELWMRGIHVPEEGHWIDLRDRDEMLDVEYVIQEHLADRAGRHFDLRLSIDGVSVSWAIPMKGKRDGVFSLPSPGDRWAAIRQPDHTLEYNSFEGEIPKGNLGAGRVKIWAKGRCDIHKIEDGNVHFSIHSGPARGSYVLVETKNGQGLIVSKVEKGEPGWKKHRYVKREEETLTDFEKQGHFVAERKVDGAAVELRIDGSRIRAFSHRASSRTGNLIEHSSRLRPILGPSTIDDTGHVGLDSLADTRLRGEAWHPRGVNFLSGTLNSSVDKARDVQRRAGPIRIDVFDITRYKGQDVTGLPYEGRRNLYVQACRELGIKHIQPVRQQETQFASFYEKQVNLRSAPTDGIVLKDVNKAYDERPWIKVKPSDTVDCRIVGMAEGLGKHTGRLGALTVETPEGKLVQVGTGLTSRERQWIWDHRQDMDQEVARVSFHIRGGQSTRSGPRFDSFHPDKSSAASLRMYAETL